MSNLTAAHNDSFDAISRRAYGSQGGAAQIASANPGVAEPIPAGTVLFIPPLIGAPTDRLPTSPADNIDEALLRVDGNRFRHWSSLVINRAIDRAPSIDVTALWEPENAELRRVFRPFSYQPADVYVGGSRIFTGTMLTPRPETDNSSSHITASAYGVTGILSDCTMPASSYSLELNEQSLDTIAKKLLTPFGIDVVFDAPVGAPFEQVALNPGSKILPFLADLAQQRNLVVGETSDGKAWFTRSSAGGKPVASFIAGQPPATNIESIFDGQSMYSHITGIAPSFAGLKGPQVTVKNPHLTSPLRPYTFQADDSQGPSLDELTNAKMGRMFANMVSWRVALPTWRDAIGALWEPNKTVMVKAPRAMIYKKTELLIRSVLLHATPSSRHAELNLVLPGAFAGKIPESLPWDE